MKNRFMKYVCALLVLTMLFAGCSKKEPATPTTTAGPTGDASYTVEVFSQGGKALSGIEIRVYKDSALTDLQWAGSTDANGAFTFTAPASDSYHVVLKNVPAGYVLAASYPLTGETTRIELKSELLTGVDLSTHKVNLGDVMFDFTVTDCNGQSYTLSQLLQEKDAVILNLWFENCGPCKQEFPHFQKAYESYGDRVALLALNPVDGTDASVAAYKADNGLTFPMAKADAVWQTVFGNIAYPTTVVIDRFGTVSLIHTGSVTDETLVDALFSYFIAEDYTQHTVSNLEDLKTEEAPAGSAENPLEFGSVTSFEVTVPAGETVYCDVYKVSGMQFCLVGEQVAVTYEGCYYAPLTNSGAPGSVSFMVTSPDTYTPVKLAITNTAAEEQTFTVSFSYLPGTMGNPYTLEMGDFDLSIPAGNDQGVYYLYVADKAGTVTVSCQEATAGVNFGITLYNLNTYTQHNFSSLDGMNLVSIDVNPGDELQVIISTLPDDENKYPTADFRLQASFAEKEISGGQCAHANTEIRNAVPADCVTDGYTGDTFCLDCNTVTASGSAISALGHQEELRRVKEATCTAEGYSGDTYCAVCNEKVRSGAAVPMIAHQDANSDNRCDTCGAITGTCRHTSTEVRNAKTASCTDNGYTGDTYCKTCGELVKTGTVVPATGHKEQLKNVKDATCTAEGYSGDSYCTVCNAKVSSGVALSKIPHEDADGNNKCDVCGTTTGTCKHSSTQVKDKKDATCTASGYTGDTYCKTCGELVKNGEIIPAAGHGKTELRDKMDATCTNAGYTGDTYCTVCNTKTASGVSTPATGHREQLKNQKAATCTAAGYTGDVYCTVCKETVTPGATIPATGHSEELRNKKDATCTNAGYTGDTYCSVCDKKLFSGSTIAATGHKDNNDDSKCDSCGVSVSKVTYTVTVVNVDGVSTKGITVKLGSYSAVTDENGVAVFNIPGGKYALTLENLDGFEVFYKPDYLTESAPEDTVSLTTVVPDGYGILEGEFVKILSTGSNSATVKAGELTYFLFRPTKAGTYQFKSSYTLKYFGTNIYFIQDQTGALDTYETTSFSLNIKDSQLGATYLIGVQAPSGKTSDTIKVTRTGDAVYGWEDKPYEIYNGTHTPQKWTFEGSADALVYLDITANSSAYTLVLGADGYYHLNSADGPVLYLNLAEGPYPECALKAMLNSNRPVVQGYVKDDNGNILSKENYNGLVQKYIDCASNGLYRLTADLIRILQTQNKNWFNFLNGFHSNINSDITWMGNICYIP